MKQLDALDILKLGHNVFLTGAAGSGKTYTLNQFIAYLKKNKIPVGITASTGIAATHMNGMTIHSWSGIGINSSLSEQDLEKIATKSQISRRMEKTKVLIIDEVSMLSGPVLDMIDQVTRFIKDKNKPFGGLQVVLSGDLFQLPPVTKNGQPEFVFQSDAWQSMNLKICYLNEQHRQEDEVLLGILNAIRDSDFEDFHYDSLNKRFNTEQKGEITKLYTHNADVDRINQTALEDLKGKSKKYKMSSNGSKKLVERMIESCLAPEELVLKIGAEVMFVSNNFADGYVNGTRGKVIGFTDEELPIIVTKNKTIVPDKFTWELRDGEKVRADITQLPLRLAWAITVHKSQGMSLDAAVIDLGKSFEPGMGYVALSRVRSMEGLHLKSINQLALTVNQDIHEFDKDLRGSSRGALRGLEQLDKEVLASQQKRVSGVLGTSADEVIEYDEAIFEKLKKWRTKLAKKRSVPAYIILSDKSLKHIAAKQPTNKKELQKIHGLGPKKIEDFATAILKLIS